MSNDIEEIRGILTAARQNAYTAVNMAMVEAYWLIGKRIVEQEQHDEERSIYGGGINTFYYHRLLSSNDNTINRETNTILGKQRPEDFIKDPYIFEFLILEQPATANESEI